MAISTTRSTAAAIMKTIWTILGSKASKCKVRMKRWGQGNPKHSGEDSHTLSLISKWEQQKILYLILPNKQNTMWLAIRSLAITCQSRGLISAIGRQASTTIRGIHQTLCVKCLIRVTRLKEKLKNLENGRETSFQDDLCRTESAEKIKHYIKSSIHQGWQGGAACHSWLPSY